MPYAAFDMPVAALFYISLRRSPYASYAMPLAPFSRRATIFTTRQASVAITDDGFTPRRL